VHPEDPAFKELVAAGVTTVLTGPGSGNLIGGQWVCLKTAPKPSVEQMVLLEPAGMKMALGENPKRVYGEQKKTPSTRMGNAAALRAALVDAQNVSSQKVGGGQIQRRPSRSERRLRIRATYRGQAGCR